MMRRNPTVLAITAEDVADYEDRRAAELRELEAAAKSRAVDPRRGVPAAAAAQGGPWTYHDSSSDDRAAYDEDEEDDYDDDARRDREHMDIDADPPMRSRAPAIVEEPSSPTGAYAAARQARSGRGRAAGIQAQARSARLQGDAAALGRGGAPAMEAAMAQQQQQQQQGARLGNAARPAGTAGAQPQTGGVVTPETRTTRTRDERIGVAPERRRR